MKYIFISLLFLSLLGCAQAQTVKITINGIKYSNTLLFSLEGEKSFLIDSINTSAGGYINYSLVKAKAHPGIYRLIFDENKSLDFVYDGEEVEIETNANNVSDSLIVIKSESNKIYYKFLKLTKDYKTKSELLQIIITRYPKEDSYYSQTENRLNELQKEYEEFVRLISGKNADSFIAKYVRSARLPVIDLSIPLEKQIDYLKANALNYVDFHNAELIYSNLFTNKTIEYLSYYRSPRLSKDLLEEEFKKAVDTLLNKAKVNQLVYQHITEYLISGFKQYGFDAVIDYIVDNYIIKDGLCLDAKTENSIQRRIDQSKKLIIGTTAPGIRIPDTNGNIIDIANIKAEKILLIFYASWCPHCKALLPEINALINQLPGKKPEVLAISLDEKKEDWINFIKENNFGWINVSDGKGWEGTASSDYLIYATPTILLLDKDKKIIAKPLKIDEIKESLQ